LRDNIDDRVYLGLLGDGGGQIRWRKEYGGLQVDQARRLKDLEQENAKLKRLVANLSLDNLVLKDISSGNF
jgi:hypothetical protein